MLTMTVALLLTAQTTPYLVIPKTRPELRSSSSISSAPTSSVSSAKSALATTRQTVLDLVNQERTKRGLASMKRNAILERAAQGHADDMLKRKYFSHLSLNKKTPEDRIRAVGYFTEPCKCSVQFSYGENIAKGQKTPKDVMTAWMNSKIHRDNILKREFSEIGIGFAGGVWVQNFGNVKVTR